MNKWKTTMIVVNDNKGRSHDYSLDKGETVADIIDVLAMADREHPDATSMVIVMVKQLRVVGE